MGKIKHATKIVWSHSIKAFKYFKQNLKIDFIDNRKSVKNFQCISQMIKLIQSNNCFSSYILYQLKLIQEVFLNTIVYYRVSNMFEIQRRLKIWLATHLSPRARTFTCFAPKIYELTSSINLKMRERIERAG